MCTDAIEHVSQTMCTDAPQPPPVHHHQSCQIDIEPPQTTPQSTLTDPPPLRDASTQHEIDIIGSLEKKILTLTQDFSQTQNSLLTQNSALKTSVSDLQSNLTHLTSQNSTLTQTLSQKTTTLLSAAQTLTLKSHELQTLQLSHQTLSTDTLKLTHQISLLTTHKTSLESKILEQLSESKIQISTHQKLST